MKILHTSDWHLGKYLENYSRLAEQEEFINELYDIVNENNIDLILIAGDIYDTINPSASAEKLFYKSILKLSDNGKRPIIIIAGNHDSSERLSALLPLALELKVVIVSSIIQVIPKIEFDDFKITNSGQGFIEIELRNEKAVIITMAYPSEKRINQSIYKNDLDEENQKNYSDKIGEIISELEKNYRDDTINIFMGHFYIVGGISENSERDISLGGNFAVLSDALPKKAQYIAMGHLHRPQKVAKSHIKDAYYSGSPIQYDKGEILHPKCVYVSDLKAGVKAETTKIYLKNYKPIEVWKTNSIEEAIEKCKEYENFECYVYLEIKTDRVLLRSEVKELRTLKKDIVEIIPIFNNDEDDEELKKELLIEKTITEEFLDFYFSNRKTKPTDELLNQFLQITTSLEEEE